jgi:hypothetical protein
MKKVYIYLLLAQLVAVPLFALGQRNNFSLIAVDIGLNNTLILNQNAYGNPEMAYEPKLGFSGMVSFRNFTGKYGYSIGLGMANLGQNYSGEMAGTAALRTVHLNYLQIPLMGMYSLGGRKKQTWIMFGPQFMFLLSARQDFSRYGGRIIPNPDLLNQGSSNVVNRFNPLDIMLAMELTQLFSPERGNTPSYKSRANKMWSLSLKAAVGLTDINRKAFQLDNTQNVYAASRNFYLGMNLGFLINTTNNSKFSQRHHTSYSSLLIPGSRR